MRTLDPFAFIDLSSLSSINIFPEFSTRCSSVVKGGPGSYHQINNQYSTKRRDEGGRKRDVRLHRRGKGGYSISINQPSTSHQRSFLVSLSSKSRKETHPQLHHNILQPSLSLFPPSRSINSVNILFQNHLIPLPLKLRHSYIDVNLLLGKQTLFHVGLNSTKQERTEHRVQLLDDVVGRFFLLGCGRDGNIGSFSDGGGLTLEPGVEIGYVGENVGEEEAVNSIVSVPTQFGER